MAQYNMPTIVPNTDTGTTLSNYLNSWVSAVESSNSGTTAPTYNAAGMPFYNTGDKSWGIWNGTNYNFKLTGGKFTVDGASGNGYFAGNVGIRHTGSTGYALRVDGEATGNAAAIFNFSPTSTNKAAIAVGLSGTQPTAQGVQVVMSDPATRDQQYGLNVTSATASPIAQSVFNVRGNGNLYSAGTGQFDGSVAIGRTAGGSRLWVEHREVGGGSTAARFDKIGSGTNQQVLQLGLSTAEQTVGHYYINAVNVSGVNQKFSVKGNGDIWAAGISATAGNAITSDPRIKKDWRDGTHDLSELDNITTGHFKFIHHDDDLEHYGFDASTIPDECKYLTNQIVPEFEDLYYKDVEVEEEVALEPGDDGYIDPNADKGDFGDEEAHEAVPQTKIVKRTERQRNKKKIADKHKVIGVNVGGMLAKTVEHNKLLKAQLDSMEARLAALESK